LSYRCTGAGPLAVHTAEDAIEAAPHVVRAVVDAADEGFTPCSSIAPPTPA
jgi:hypothetical protein